MKTKTNQRGESENAEKKWVQQQMCCVCKGKKVNAVGKSSLSFFPLSRILNNDVEFMSSTILNSHNSNEKQSML